jgi:hypothetical protein
MRTAACTFRDRVGAGGRQRREHASGTLNSGPGFVGASYDEIVIESGRLFLGLNDQKQTFDDNSGAFTVTITLSC